MKQDMEEATLTYWRVSLTYNGRAEGEPLTTSQAIQRLRIHLDYLNPGRRVAKRILDLSTDIIYGINRSKHVKAP